MFIIRFILYMLKATLAMAMLRDRKVGTGEGINPGRRSFDRGPGKRPPLCVYKVEAECNNAWDDGQQSITAAHLNQMREVMDCS